MEDEYEQEGLPFRASRSRSSRNPVSEQQGQQTTVVADSAGRSGENSSIAGEKDPSIKVAEDMADVFLVCELLP
jgi:hypothetical protein